MLKNSPITAYFNVAFGLFCPGCWFINCLHGVFCPMSAGRDSGGCFFDGLMDLMEFAAKYRRLGRLGFDDCN
jgi:hypothetical protein